MTQSANLFAQRYDDSTSTSRNLGTILDVLGDTQTSRVTLFASPEHDEGLYDPRTDGPTTNLPLVAALAEIRVTGAKPVHVVFDGLFLTAQRKPRYDEVKSLLDAAVASGKAFVATERAPFTSSLPPNEAAQALLNVAATAVPLNESSRRSYFGQLANLSETEYQKVFA
ncbi:hypothetical protein [Aromatoleum evansii]|uniref:hypothetical protein n=1 Tax=Aromatoleum evansii TaxID=59406 RepID=UPI00145DE1EF|nr:hypothetical protein [Aromatoleum evansii]NMG28433.1 hypothetical protein [Aromatoleum evansii]